MPTPVARPPATARTRARHTKLLVILCHNIVREDYPSAGGRPPRTLLRARPAEGPPPPPPPRTRAPPTPAPPPPGRGPPPAPRPHPRHPVHARPGADARRPRGRPGPARGTARTLAGEPTGRFGQRPGGADGSPGPPDAAETGETD